MIAGTEWTGSLIFVPTLGKIRGNELSALLKTEVTWIQGRGLEVAAVLAAPDEAATLVVIRQGYVLPTYLS